MIKKNKQNKNSQKDSNKKGNPQKDTMQQNNKQSREYKKLGFKETLNVLVWTSKFLLSLQGPRIILSLILDVISSNQNIVYTFLTAKVIDQVVYNTTNNISDFSGLYIYVYAIFIYYVLNRIIIYVDVLNSLTIDSYLSLDIENEITKKIYSLDINKLENNKNADKINRAKSSRGHLYLVLDRIIRLTSSAVGLIISFSLIFTFLPLYIPILIFIVGVIRAIVQNKMQEKIYFFRYNNTENIRVANRNYSSVSSVISLKELKLSNSINFLYKKYYDYQLKYNKKVLNLTKNRFTSTTLVALVSDILDFYAYIIIIGKALNKLITVGDITFQFGILSKLVNNLNVFFIQYTTLVDSSFRASEVRELFLIQNDKNIEDIKIQKLDKGPSIEINNLSFKYPESKKYILNNINLNIKSGEKVAIVGHNGAGKTTLIKLISKIYNYDLGDILLNNQPLNRIEKDSYYNNLGVLFQDFNTYSQLSVKENVAIGNVNTKSDDNKVIDALKHSDAYSFVQEYDNKLDQILSPDIFSGTRPSQGEWQKIAIARFFYRDAPLVIFDEPTAAIDAVSEYKIFNRIYKFFKGKTVILISHRFSTVRNADKIIVLDKGKIAEVGNHDELIKNNGVYAHSFNLQAEGYK